MVFLFKKNNYTKIGLGGFLDYKKNIFLTINQKQCKLPIFRMNYIVQETIAWQFFSYDFTLKIY